MPAPTGSVECSGRHSKPAILVGQSLQQIFHPDDGILSAAPISGRLRLFYSFAYAVIQQEGAGMSEAKSNAATSETLVSFRGVQKSYDGESLIVKDLNLDIRKGEFLTLSLIHI